MQTQFIQVLEYNNELPENLYLKPEKIELFFWTQNLNRNGYYLVFVVNNYKYYLSENNNVVNFNSIDDVICKLKVIGIYF